MDDFVTVVSVENGINEKTPYKNFKDVTTNPPKYNDSQFITVLSINDENTPNYQLEQPEEVIVYRLLGERLGFGLKFQGGIRSAENVQRLFIQSCANDSPASRSKSSWGHLREGDEIVEIDGIDIRTMTRLECVKCLKQNNLAIKLLVRNGGGRPYGDFDNDNRNIDANNISQRNMPPPPPAVPPRKLTKRKLSNSSNGGGKHSEEANSADKSFTPPPDAEYYINLFSDENEAKIPESESDDTCSTISTVVDNFSLHSNTDLNCTISGLQLQSTKSNEIEKALNSFTLLEKEFYIDEANVVNLPHNHPETNLQPPLGFQDNGRMEELTKAITKSETQYYENMVSAGALLQQHKQTYENIDIENRKPIIRSVKMIPTPLPRQTITNSAAAEDHSTKRIVIPTANVSTINLISTVEPDAAHECEIVLDKNEENNQNKSSPSSSDDNNNSSDDTDDNLGPPELANSPDGPSEAYLNYHWSLNLLPPIGEVEEEFSSLEQPSCGPIVIIDSDADKGTNIENVVEQNNIINNNSTLLINEKPITTTQLLATTVDTTENIIINKNLSQNDNKDNCSNKGLVCTTTVTSIEPENELNNSKNVMVVNAVCKKSPVISERTKNYSENLNTKSVVERKKSKVPILIVHEKEKCMEKNDEIVINTSKIPKRKSSDVKKSEKFINLVPATPVATVLPTLPKRTATSSSKTIALNNMNNKNTSAVFQDVDSEKIENLNKNISKNNDQLDATIVNRIVLGNEEQQIDGFITSIEHVTTKPQIIDHAIKSTAAGIEEQLSGMDHKISSLMTSPAVTTSTQILSASNDAKLLLSNSPPTFSRLPPDGHEFPPNFSEPHIIIPILKQQDLKNNKLSSFKPDDAPPLPTSIPPLTVPRKMYRQDLIINVDDSRRSLQDPIMPSINHDNYPTNLDILSSKPFSTTATVQAAKALITNNNNNNVEMKRRTIENQNNTINSKYAKQNAVTPNKGANESLSSMWRKDEKSGKSVRDKIAMFSIDESPLSVAAEKTSPPQRKSSFNFKNSQENLLADNKRKRQEFAPLLMSKKSQSVENLDDEAVGRTAGMSANIIEYSTKPKYSLLSSSFGKSVSVENLNNYEASHQQYRKPNLINGNIPQPTALPSSYASLPRSKAPSVTRTTSFSGTPNYEDRRRQSISSLLEQRKKSMSKLRGLIIPEKADMDQVLLDLPEIKSTDLQKISFPSSVVNCSSSNGYVRREPVLSNPLHYTSTYQAVHVDSSYESIFDNNTSIFGGRKEKLVSSSIIMPPVKPPRTSLLHTSRSSSFESHKSLDDSEDSSDSVFSSKISPPAGSPVAITPPEKFPLTRTLSNETNTSIASSTTSTLTSGSGSQASCSSVGSTPTIDMSRKVLKSSSNESYVNRKNILALAKCRSGKDDAAMARQQYKTRYEDEDSTDGYEEEEVRPKPKQRSSFTNTALASSSHAGGKTSSDKRVNYRLLTSNDNIVDMVINVASYVEVTNSDTDIDAVDKHFNKKELTNIPDNKKFNDLAAVLTPPPVLPQKIHPDQIKKQIKQMQQQVEKSKLANNLPLEDSTNKSIRDDNSTTKNKVPSSVSFLENIKKFNSPVSGVELSSNKSNLSPIQSNKCQIAPTIQTNSSTKSKEKINNYHERYSSLDSMSSSSSSGISSIPPSSLTSSGEIFSHSVLTPDGKQSLSESLDKSFKNLNINHTLINEADLQSIIEEADPPLKTPEAMVIILTRDSPECSVGITLAGGADYETKEITIHRILTNSPAFKDGRLQKGDRILSINGLSMRGLTHRESVTVLKAPRSEVVMVITRSASVITHNTDSFSTKATKRSLVGSMTSLILANNDRNASYHDDVPQSPSLLVDRQNNRAVGFLSSRVIDLDIDLISNTEDSLASSMGDDEYSIASSAAVEEFEVKGNQKIVEILKDNCGLGLAIEGGLDSPSGHKPLTIKKVFMGGAAEKTGRVSVGDIIISINDVNTESITRVQAWNFMKSLSLGPVKFVLSSY